MSQIGRDRVEDRTRTTVRAQMRDSRCERDICIIDVSTRGLLATTARPPKRGDFIELHVGCNLLTGQVKWASERRFGISLRERISVTAIVEGGKQEARLQRSVGVRKVQVGWLDGLRANPQALGKLGEFAMLGVAALCAAYMIVELTGAGFEPLQQALSGANTAREPVAQGAAG